MPTIPSYTCPYYYTVHRFAVVPRLQLHLFPFIFFFFFIACLPCSWDRYLRLRFFLMFFAALFAVYYKLIIDCDFCTLSLTPTHSRFYSLSFVHPSLPSRSLQGRLLTKKMNFYNVVFNTNACLFLVARPRNPLENNFENFLFYSTPFIMKITVEKLERK